MRKIIEGKVYDTATAEQICDVSGKGGTLFRSDFGWENTSLYKSPKGAFFIAGEGGATTRWGERVGDSRQGGDGLTLVTKDEARRLVETHGTTADFVRTFGEPEQG